MIIGIGVDIVKTARFEGMTERFMARVFTSNERAYLLGKSHVSAAGMFAAKEAVAKALGTGFKGFWPSQVEVVHDENGRPGVVLHGEAEIIASGLAGVQNRASAEIMDRTSAEVLNEVAARGPCGYSFHLSISHTAEDAIAFVVMSCDNV